nr:ankyrin repeat protein [Megavirus caiporensis]
MEKHITYILTQVKILTPIPIIDEDTSRIEENIKTKLDKILKNFLIECIKEDYCSISIDEDDCEYDDNKIVNVQVDKKTLNMELEKNLDPIVKNIIYDYINIKYREEYINGNREKAMTYFQYIDVNYNYYKNSNNCHSILYYATSKEDVELIKRILEKKPHNYYEISKTENFEIIGLLIDYICDNNIDNQDDYNYRFYLFSPNNKKNFIIKHPRAKEFLGRSYNDIAKKHFNNNSKY